MVVAEHSAETLASFDRDAKLNHDARRNQLKVAIGRQADRLANGIFGRLRGIGVLSAPQIAV
jgi:hypothetical protein